MSPSFHCQNLHCYDTLWCAQSPAKSRDGEKRAGYIGANHTGGCTLLHREERPEKCTCRENSPSLSLFSGLSASQARLHSFAPQREDPFSVSTYCFLGCSFESPQLCCSPSLLTLPHLCFVSYETHWEVRLWARVSVASGRDSEWEIRETVRKMSSCCSDRICPKMGGGRASQRKTVIHSQAF